MRVFCLAFIVLFVQPLIAEDYPVFDGRFYNGLYYPRINVVEWDKPEYLVFNIFSKEKPVDLTGKVIRRGGQKVFQFQYHLKDKEKGRDEKVCRSVIAPASFRVGQKLNYYIDKSDHKMDQIYVSARSMSKKMSYKTEKFDNCIAQKKKTPKRAVASTPKVVETKKLKIKKGKLPVWFDDKPTHTKNFDLFGEQGVVAEPPKKIEYFF